MTDTKNTNDTNDTKDTKSTCNNDWSVVEYYASGDYMGGVPSDTSDFTKTLVEALESYESFDNKYKVFEAPTNPKTGKPFLSGMQFDAAKKAFEANGKVAITKKDHDTIVSMVCAFQQLPELHNTKGFVDPDWSVQYEYMTMTTEVATENFSQYADCILNGFLTKILATSRPPLTYFGEGSVKYRAIEEFWGQKCWYMQYVHQQITGETLPTRFLLVEKTCPHRITEVKFNDLTPYSKQTKEMMKRVVDNNSTYKNMHMNSIVL